MKKIIVIMIIMLALSLRLSSQTDKFFSYHHENRESKEWSEVVLLPNVHGLDYNYPADEAPLSSGYFLLVAMAIGYIVLVKRPAMQNPK